MMSEEGAREVAQRLGNAEAGHDLLAFLVKKNVWTPKEQQEPVVA